MLCLSCDEKEGYSGIELMWMQGMNDTSCVGLKGVTTSLMAPAATSHGLFGRIFQS